MKVFFKNILNFIFAAVILFPFSVECGEVYTELMKEFSKYDNRLPGSENFKKCSNKLQQVLEENDIKVNRQLYYTLVPETKVCRFSIDGRDG